jgi:Ca2+-binding RTX toxin-like protein
VTEAFAPEKTMSDVRLIQGDCLDVLRRLEPSCVDAVVTDPPYGQSNERYDKGVSPAVWRECFRVAKPNAASPRPAPPNSPPHNLRPLETTLKLTVEALETRALPSASLVGGLLCVVEPNHGTHTVSVDRVAAQIQVTEGDGSGAGNVVSLFDSAAVTSVFVQGAEHGVNVIQQNTSLPSVLLGGDRADTIFGGTGLNQIDPGKGHDTVYALLGVNTISVAGEGTDRVFTNFGAVVSADNQDTVVRFFGPGRTPGAPFIGFDTTLNDSALYITPSNNGSSVTLDPGADKGDVVATYDLGDGNGLQTQTFSGVQTIAYFGGAGNDTFVDNTRLPGAAYGSAGNDTLYGGTGAFFILKGSGGNDVLVGRARHNDLSGNGGADVLTDLGNGRADIFRVDALDTVFGLMAGDITISP